MINNFQNQNQNQDDIKLKKNIQSIQKSVLIEEVIKLNRVSKVTKGGKKFSFRAVIAIGDQNGQIAIGMGKSTDISVALKKASMNGQKYLIKFPITKSYSIPYNVSGTFGACKVIMKSSNKSSGIIAGGSVRTLLKVAGIKNIITKQVGSKNLLNNAKATICAFKNLIIKSQITNVRKLKNK